MSSAVDRAVAPGDVPLVNTVWLTVPVSFVRLDGDPGFGVVVPAVYPATPLASAPRGWGNPLHIT